MKNKKSTGNNKNKIALRKRRTNNIKIKTTNTNNTKNKKSKNHMKNNKNKRNK